MKQICYIVLLFRNLPVNQKRSKFTGFCNKQVFMKLFKTSDINIVKICQSLFSFDLPSVIVEKRAKSSITVYDVIKM